ncbi:MAG: hypothetical protein AB1921_14300, partial [Thermodesulfobacteriota bacterium]
MSRRADKRMPSKPAPLKSMSPEELLQRMVDGKEAMSLLTLPPGYSLDIIESAQLVRKRVEELRGRPLLIYIANTVSGGKHAAIGRHDELYFNEMVSSVPTDKKDIDFCLITNGGEIDQIPRFVNTMRPRFTNINFILPESCMSAG